MCDTKQPNTIVLSLFSQCGRGFVFLFLLLFSTQAGYAQAVSYDFEQDSIYYNFLSFSDHTVEVSKHPKGFYHDDVVVPSQVKFGSSTWTVVQVGDNAFQLCASLTSVTLPETITSIGVRAFQYCPLSSITIPNAVTTIGTSAFQDCYNLESLMLPASLTSVPASMCYNSPQLQSVTIPDGVTSIGDYAFYKCSALKTASIPNGVTSIGEYAFYGCSQLSGVTLPESLTEISKYSFFQTGLTEVVIPNSVTKVRVAAFAACPSLKSVTIPASPNLSTIHTQAFLYCYALESVYIAFTNAQNIASCFDPDVSTIYVPRGSLQAYKESSYGWDKFQLAEYDPVSDGIDLPATNRTVQKIYTIDGLQRKALGKGMNILRMSDGSVRKVVK